MAKVGLEWEKTLKSLPLVPLATAKVKYEEQFERLKKMEKQKELERWLQNYADENHAYVGVNSDYSPCVCAFWEKPKLKYDEDDGYWRWTRPSWKTKFKWLDDEILEELRMVRFDKSFAKRLFRPQSLDEEIV